MEVGKGHDLMTLRYASHHRVAAVLPAGDERDDAHGSRPNSATKFVLRGRSYINIEYLVLLIIEKRVAVILREHLPDDFLPPPIQTPLTESDQGNLVGNFLA